MKKLKKINFFTKYGIRNTEYGFTLLEILFTILAFSLILGTLYGVYVLAIRTWEKQDPRTLLLDQLNDAMNEISREMKYVGALTIAEALEMEFSEIPKNVETVDSYTVSLWHFNEGSGTTSADAAGVNDATFPGSAGQQPIWTTAGEDGNALEFDGSDYLDCGNHSSLDLTNKFTIEAWTQSAAEGNDEAVIYKDGSYRLYINDANKLVGSIYYGGIWHEATGATSIFRNGSTWTHVAMTYDKDEGGTEELKVYVNGYIDGTADHSTAVDVTTNNLFIGQGVSGSWMRFDGKIDEVRILNDIMRTKFSWTGTRYADSQDVNDMLAFSNEEKSYQLVDGYTQSFDIDYFDEDYNEILPPDGTDTQTERNNIKIVRISLGLEHGGEQISFTNTTSYLKREIQTDVVEEVIGHWRMNKAGWSGVSDEVEDVSGNGNHCTAAGGATTTEDGKLGRAGIFDGAGDYASADSSDTLNISGASSALTILAWIKPGTLTGDHIIAGKARADQDTGYSFKTINSGAELQLKINDQTATFATANFVADTWYHVAATYQSNETGLDTVKLYKDRTEEFNDTIDIDASGIDSNSYDFVIGADHRGNDEWVGQIDDVLLYNYVLTEDQIKGIAGFDNDSTGEFDGDTSDDTAVVGGHVELAQQ